MMDDERPYQLARRHFRRRGPVGPTIYRSDTFNRVDAANLGVPDVGPAWEEDPDFFLQGGHAKVISGGVGDAAVGECGVADLLVEVDLTLFVVEAGMVVRTDGHASNTKIIWIPLSATSMLLRKYIAGVQTNLGVITVPAMGNGTRIGVRLSGTSVTGRVHGSDVGTAIVPDAALLTKTKHGIMRLNGSSNGNWKNFLARSF